MSDNLPQEKLAKIPELLAFGAPENPPYAHYLEGKCYWKGKGVQQDTLKGLKLLTQGVFNTEETDQVSQDNYLKDIPDLLGTMDETGDLEVKITAWLLMKKILTDATGTLEDMKHLEGPKTSAYLHRSFFEKSPDKEAWLGVAIAHNVPEAQDHLDSFLEHKKAQEEFSMNTPPVASAKSTEDSDAEKNS